MPKPKIELTDSLIDDITAKLKASGSLHTALSTCGIPRETYDLWIEESKRTRAKPLTEKLAAEVDLAEAKVKIFRENQLTKYFEKDWRALAWWLERKYPDEYAAKKPKEARPEQPDLPDYFDPLR